MATGKLTFDEGTTTNVATYTITEDALSKHINRTVLNTEAGVELGTNAAPIQIGDAGGSLTVDGTVGISGTVPVSAASLPLPTGASTEATLSSLNGKVTACNTGAVVVSSSALPTGASTSAAQTTGNNSLSSIDGKITACNTGAVVISSGTVTSLTQMNGQAIAMGTGVRTAGTQRVTIATDDVVPVSQSGSWSITANSTPKTILSATGVASSSGNNTLVAAGTNKLKAFAFSLSTTSTTAVICIFQSGAGGTNLWSVELQAITGSNTGANLTVTPPSWIFATASATLLNLNLSAAVSVRWAVSYFDEA